MQSGHTAEVADLPAPFLETETKRQILVVHEDLVGHPPHIQYHRSADHDEGTHERLHVAIAFVIPVPHHLVRKDPAVGKEHMEIESLPNEIQEPIMSPGRFNLNSSVRKQNSAPDGTKGGVRVQFPDASHERVISDLYFGEGGR